MDFTRIPFSHTPVTFVRTQPRGFSAFGCVVVLLVVGWLFLQGSRIAMERRHEAAETAFDAAHGSHQAGVDAALNSVRDALHGPADARAAAWTALDQIPGPFTAIQTKTFDSLRTAVDHAMKRDRARTSDSLAKLPSAPRTETAEVRLPSFRVLDVAPLIQGGTQVRLVVGPHTSRAQCLALIDAYRGKLSNGDQLAVTKYSQAFRDHMPWCVLNLGDGEPFFNDYIEW